MSGKAVLYRIGWSCLQIVQNSNKNDKYEKFQDVLKSFLSNCYLVAGDNIFRFAGVNSFVDLRPNLTSSRSVLLMLSVFSLIDFILGRFALDCLSLNKYNNKLYKKIAILLPDPAQLTESISSVCYHISS